MIETDAAANNRRWDFLINGEQFALRVINDANSSASNVFVVDRTGTTVDSVNFHAPLRVSGNTVWHGGNDGAGSGLDADIVRGNVPVKGSGGSVSPSTISNADTLTEDGFYNVGSSWTGSPFSGANGSNQGYIIHQQWANSSGLYAVQTHQEVNANKRRRFRIKDNGTWGAWQYIWTENNGGSGSGLDADTVRGLTFRNSGGYLEYYEGSKWRRVGNPLLLASNTVREQTMTERIAATGGSSNILLHKFIPSGTGEVVIKGEVAGNGASSGVIRILTSLGDTPSYQAGPATNGVDYRTAVGTVFISPSGLTTSYGIFASSSSTTYVAFSVTVRLMRHEPLYVFLQAGDIGVKARNIQICYDEV